MGQSSVSLGFVVVLAAGVFVSLGELKFEQFVDVVTEVEPTAFLLFAVGQHAVVRDRTRPGEEIGARLKTFKLLPKPEPG